MLRKWTKAGYELLTYAGTAVKALGDRRFEGYLIAYSPPAPIDLHGQHFSEKTERMPEMYPVEGAPILWNHGFDERFGSFKMGLFDFVKEDAKGVFVQGVMKDYLAYIETLDKINSRRALNFRDEQIETAARAVQDSFDYLLAQNILALSSGSRPPDVRVAPSGHIDVWLVEEGSLTQAPAAPSGTAVQRAKSLIALTPSFAKSAVDVFKALKESGGFIEEHLDQSREQDDEPVIEIIDLRHVKTNDNRDETQAQQDSAGASTRAITGARKAMNMQELIARLKEILGMLEESAGSGEGDMMPEEQRAALIAQAEQAARSAGLNETATATDAQIAVAETAVAKGYFAWRKTVADKQESIKADARKRAFELQREHAPLAAASDSAGGAGHSAGSLEVTGNYTKWDDLSAEAMSYAHQFLKGVGRHKASLGTGEPYVAGEDFYIALSHKMSRSLAENSEAFPDTYVKGLEKLVGMRLDGMRNLGAIEKAFAQKAVSTKANELLHTNQTGYGAEWIPELWLSQLQKQARLENNVLPQFTQINMPSDPFNIPLEGTDPSVKVIPEATAITQLVDTSGNIYGTPQKPSTVKAQLATGKLGMRVGWSEEQTEDSIIPFAETMREKGMLAMRDAIDYVLLNADNDTTAATTTNINYYGGAALPATDELYLVGWDGVLVYPLNNVSTYGVNASAAAPTLAMIRSLQAKLPARYGKIDDLVIFCDYRTSIALKNISQLETLEKYGNNATVLKGEIGRIDNIPVIMTSQLALAHTDGRISSTSSNNTKGRLILMNKRNRWVGFRRKPVVTVEYVGRYGAYLMWASMRIAYTPFDNEGTAVLYNILV